MPCVFRVLNHFRLLALRTFVACGRLKQELNLGGDFGADIEMADGMKTKIMHDGDI